MKKLFLTSTVDNVAHDIVKKTGKNLKTVFITTSVEPYENIQDLQWLKDDRNSLKDAGFIVTDYTITGKTKLQIKKDFSNFDVIYVSGGNTFYLLEKILQSNSADVFRECVENGKIYIGTSAGSIVAGPDTYPAYNLDRVEQAPNLKGYKGLGLVDFVVLPHWGSDKFKDEYLNKRLQQAYSLNNKIILLTDFQYVQVEDNTFKIIEVEHNEYISRD